MALGQKLGKIFGAIGSGLSFIPGPWSAVGMALGAAGSAASAVGEAKDRKEAQKMREEQTMVKPTQQAEAVDNQRAEEGNLQTPAPQMPGPTSARVFQQDNSRYNLGQMGENLDDSVMKMLIRQSGGWYD